MVRVKMKVAMWAGLRSVRAHIMHLHTACTRVGVYKYMGSIRICSPPHISHDLCASVPATVGLCARTCVLRVPARARCSSRQRCRVLDADSSSTSRLIASGAPGGGLIFAKFKLRSRRALISHEKVQSYKNAFISHPSQPFLKPNQEKTTARGWSLASERLFGLSSG